MNKLILRPMKHYTKPKEIRTKLAYVPPTRKSVNLNLSSLRLLPHLLCMCCLLGSPDHLVTTLLFLQNVERVLHEFWGVVFQFDVDGDSKVKYFFEKRDGEVVAWLDFVKRLVRFWKMKFYLVFS